MKEEIPTSEYMVDGWDRGPTGCHHYKRGSFHNKFGMWIMWLFYGIVIVQVIHAIYHNDVNTHQIKHNHVELTMQYCIYYLLPIECKGDF